MTVVKNLDQFFNGYKQKHSDFQEKIVKFSHKRSTLKILIFNIMKEIN